MIMEYGPVTQALLGTLMTWGLTALGSAMVVFLHSNEVKPILKCRPPVNLKNYREKR